ncbi:hypothetical protein DL764_003715 [Monosporascus ibericus]|uniref:Uncharacterized protein n=1 Tax=Monosporascus ibericus TaxID=155417 RepID=A0A4Q4TG20_9PEZI|nr:hypothetical protein DL764_003715 [Monosporascus ibericus]
MVLLHIKSCGFPALIDPLGGNSVVTTTAVTFLAVGGLSADLTLPTQATRYTLHNMSFCETPSPPAEPAQARMYKIRLGKWGLFENKCTKRTEFESTNAAAGESIGSQLGDRAERAWKCNTRQRQPGWRTRGGEGRQQQQQSPRDGLAARGIWEFVRSFELLGQCAEPEGIAELVHSCQETRVWFYVEKATPRALMDTNALEKAEEPAKKLLEITDSALDAGDIRPILLRCSFGDLLERAAKLGEGRLAREDNIRCAEKLLAKFLIDYLRRMHEGVH